MSQMIAICGLNCAECEAYLATQANDEVAKERVAAKWRVEYNHPAIDVAYVTCDGCRAFQGRLGGHCPECDIRACGIARDVPNCAYCGDYATCQKLADFLNFVPQTRTTLDGIRCTL